MPVTIFRKNIASKKLNTPSKQIKSKKNRISQMIFQDFEIKNLFNIFYNITLILTSKAVYILHNIFY